MATLKGSKDVSKEHHEIRVAEDLALPSKRAAIHKIVQSIKDELARVEQNLLEVGAATGKVEDLGKTLLQLQSKLSESVEYLPPYEQRLLQSRISSANRLLVEKRSEINAGQGFSFRKTPKQTKILKTPLEVVDIPDAPVISPTNIQLSVDQSNVLSLGDARKVEKKFERNSLKNKDVLLSSLVDCQIFLQGCSSTLNLKNLTGCLIVCGPVRTSVFVSGCKDCTIVVACQQLRIHDSDSLRFYVHLTCGGILEDTRNCSFAPYNVVYPGLDCDFAEANLRQDGNDHWQQIEDFDYVVSKKRSPNWTIIPDNERRTFEMA